MLNNFLLFLLNNLHTHINIVINDCLVMKVSKIYLIILNPPIYLNKDFTLDNKKKGSNLHNEKLLRWKIIFLCTSSIFIFK